MNLFRNLRADEIECRRGRQVGNGVEILLYKTSRTDMSLLDETFGNFGWACQYKEVNGSLFCGLAIGLSALFQGKCAAAAADALGSTGKGTANYFIVIGIVETVALFTLVFGLLLLNG